MDFDRRRAVVSPRVHGFQRYFASGRPKLSPWGLAYSARALSFFGRVNFTMAADESYSPTVVRQTSCGVPAAVFSDRRNLALDSFSESAHGVAFAGGGSDSELSELL